MDWDQGDPILLDLQLFLFQTHFRIPMLTQCLTFQDQAQYHKDDVESIPLVSVFSAVPE